MNNVVPFPRKGAIDHLPSTSEEAESTLETIRHTYVDQVVETLVSTLVQQMMAGGFDILDDERSKDFAFLIEAVRSSLCATVDIYHPFQEVSEKILEEVDEEGCYKVASEISLKFDDEEEDAQVPYETSQ